MSDGIKVAEHKSVNCNERCSVKQYQYKCDSAWLKKNVNIMNTFE